MGVRFSEEGRTFRALKPSTGTMWGIGRGSKNNGRRFRWNMQRKGRESGNGVRRVGRIGIRCRFGWRPFIVYLGV